MGSQSREWLSVGVPKYEPDLKGGILQFRQTIGCNMPPKPEYPLGRV